MKKKIYIYRGNRSIHLSFDVDALDPQIIPSTGTPGKHDMKLKKVFGVAPGMSCWSICDFIYIYIYIYIYIVIEDITLKSQHAPTFEYSYQLFQLIFKLYINDF